MRYTPKTGSADSVSKDPEALLFDSLEPVVKGLGMSLIELTISRHKGSVQVRAVVYRLGVIGVEDVALAHRAFMPRLELAFSGQDIYLEVSSPGIDRRIKDGSEFIHYTGRGVKCYRTDISDWTGGILGSADETGIILKTPNGELHLDWEIIAKAKLSHLEEAGG
jgi:ribosome maturation factor RimP